MKLERVGIDHPTDLEATIHMHMPVGVEAARRG